MCNLVELQAQDTTGLTVVSESWIESSDQYGYTIGVSRYPGFTEIRPGTTMSNEDPIYLLGHPTDAEILVWWLKDLARPVEERITDYADIVQEIGIAAAIGRAQKPKLH
jgi:hypothetical protein